MYMQEYKQKYLKDLKVGESFRGMHYPNGKHVWGPTYTIEERNNNQIKCTDSWHDKITYFSIDEDTKVEVPLTEQEYKSKYFHTAKEIVQGLQNKLYSPGDAYHEMWNGWIGINPYEMAQDIVKHKLIIIGYFPLSTVLDTRDIGIVAEDEDGDRVWCHANSVWFEPWEEYFPELYKEEN